MPTIRKVTEDISTVFKELKQVLGSDDLIIRSMKQYLDEYYAPIQNHLKEILDGLPLNDIIVHKNDSGRFDFIEYMPESNSTGKEAPLSNILNGTGDIVTLPYDPNTDIAIIKEEKEEFDYHFESYRHLIKWGLWVISNNIPDIFKTGSSEGYHTGIFGIYGFSVEFPNKITIHFHIHEENSKIDYYIDLKYDDSNSKAFFFRESDLYKSAMKNGWKDLY